ncbi:MAG: exodeoxyribonuclease III [Steroidobacteraceae bacterium]
MRVLTLNVNGIRAAAGKGLYRWLLRQKADVICLQETKAQLAALDPAPFALKGYDFHYYDAEKKGYSGVALYTRRPADRVIRGFGTAEFDREGRFLEAQFGTLSVISLYLPSGSSGEHRQASKFRFLDAFRPELVRMRDSDRQYILCGDWNIAHKPIDLRNWRSNQKNSGFLPEERAWLDELIDDYGFVDAFRIVDQRPEQYTWWSNRGEAWSKNVGWRIDYQMVSPALRERVRRASIYKRSRFSDHAPLIIDYELD